MKKEDLKYGMVVELKNKERFLYLKNDTNTLGDIDFVSLNDKFEWFGLYQIDDDLKNIYDFANLDIVKVYRDYTCQELLWERKEIKLTEDEKAILRNIDEDYKWIARDCDNFLGIYKEKPIKDEHGRWNDSILSFESLYLFNHLFQFIQWEDDEPYCIEDLLKESGD